MISAVDEILDASESAFCYGDTKKAYVVEPLEEVIDMLNAKIKKRHIARVQRSECTIELGFVLNDLLNNLERVADHCSNIAGCMIEMEHDALDLHDYLNKVKTFDDFQSWLSDANPTVFKINLYFRDEKSRSEIPSMMKAFPDLFVCHSPGGDLEITDVHATKGLALIALGKHLGLSPEQMIAFGDTDNDIDMLKTVGIGVAMANARPEALAVADRVTRSNDEDGVAWAIEQWVLNQPHEV
jgi:hydroxymethylpyrimidine pyrophosphatase-like HAD family hydrolase